MADDTETADTGPGREDGSSYDAGCAFQDATDLAARFTRLGLEVAAAPLAWLPDETRSQLRQGAGEALRNLAVGPRILSGVLDELAREVEVSLEESNLGQRRREEESPAAAPHEESR